MSQAKRSASKVQGFGKGGHVDCRLCKVTNVLFIWAEDYSASSSAIPWGRRALFCHGGSPLSGVLLAPDGNEVCLALAVAAPPQSPLPCSPGLVAHLMDSLLGTGVSHPAVISSTVRLDLAVVLFKRSSVAILWSRDYI